MSLDGQRLCLVVPLIVFFLLTAPAPAQQWDSPAKQLVEKIVAHAQSRSAVSLDVRNLSSLPQAQVAEVRRALESQLRAAGVRLVAQDQAVDEARVTLSENAAGFLWVAEVGHGDAWDVVMAPVAVAAAPDRAPATLVLRRALLWSGADQPLDLASLDENTLLILERDAVTLYRREGKQWQAGESAGLNHPRPFPRDLRGRMLVEPEGRFRAYLPGIKCAGTTQPQLNVFCREIDDPWPLSSDLSAFFSNRNFFTGAVRLADSGEAGEVGPFYSAALNRQSDGGFWLVASTEGSVRLISTTGQVVGTFTGWGSDVVGLASDCDTKWHALATRAGDDAVADSLQAYEVAGPEAIEAGSPLEFAGPITALWNSNDSRSATAIVHNLKTGNYEAFVINAVCGR